MVVVLQGARGCTGICFFTAGVTELKLRSRTLIPTKCRKKKKLFVYSKNIFKKS